MSGQPRRRAGDRLRIHVRENWYRDVCLAALSVVVILALFAAQDAIEQIQASRLANCQAQNQRHNRTVATLDRRLGPLERTASKSRRAQLATSRAFTVALIDQLAPRQDCRAVIARTVAPR